MKSRRETSHHSRRKSRNHVPLRARGKSDTHPAERFKAPSTIQHGVPLRNLIGKQVVELLSESMEPVVPKFDAKQFRHQAMRGLDKLELNQRGLHIAKALAEQLPEDFEKAAVFLIASFGPELKVTEGNGLAPFFYLPHAYYIANWGVGHFESGMRANYEITKRFSAEFSIRPFLIAKQTECLRRLMKWTTDKNPHVRRLVSEGTRPRLPWAMRLRAFQENPHLSLPLLEKLKDDSDSYVRRSVANHLGDIAKDHPEVVYELCGHWLEEVSSSQVNPEQASARRWIIRHAIRLPAKKGEPRAVKLRQAAK